ncbi:MAG: hypothetical protein EOP49_32855, partial [Sphingobacteriales bacterium]
MKKSLFLSAVAVFGLGSIGDVLAQNETDALRYSQLQFGGTSRIQGLAGAQTALGADLSNLNGNPAGLGMYRRSDFGISAGLTFGSMSTQFQGQTTTDNKDNFNIPNFGFVFTNYKGDDSDDDWKSTSFGVGFTRQAHFHNRFNFAGLNNDNSITQSLLTNGYLYDLAYKTYLINPDSTDTYDYPAIEGGGVYQSEYIYSRGASNQWDISLGTNYRDKLFLGATLGFTSVNYKQVRSFKETNETAASTLNDLTINDEFRTTGGGINVKIGAIYRPVNWLRVGATVQTPTYSTLSDSYSAGISSNFSADSVMAGGTTVPLADGRNLSSGFSGTFEYNLSTPFRASGGIAAFAGKYGFVSADVEYVNYTHARFSTDNPEDDFATTNNLIKQQYTSAINLRVGAEYRYEIFRVRGGYALYGDPFAHSSLDQSRTFYTGGVGIKQERFYFDLAYIHSFYESAYQSYTLPDVVTPGAVTKNTYADVYDT